MRVSMLVASDEATSGSLIAKHDRIAPASSGSSQRSRCIAVAKKLQQLDVAAVGRAAVEYLGRPRHPTHDLAERRVVEVGEARAGLIVAQPRQEQVPEPECARLLLQRLEHIERVHAGVGVAITRRTKAAPNRR